MKYLYTFILLISSLSLFSQDTAWHLPMKGKYVNYTFIDTLNNTTKNDLCHYYIGPVFHQKLNSRISQNEDKLSKDKSTSYKESKFFVLFSPRAGREVIKECNKPGFNDTFIGQIDASTSSISSVNIPGKKNKFGSVSIQVSFKIIFIGTSSYKLVIKGFRIKPMLEEEIDIEEMYNAFLASEKKSNSELKFYENFNLLMKLLNESVSYSLQKCIDLENE